MYKKMIKTMKTMKNFKLMKTVFLLFALVAFSNCEDNEPIKSELKTNTSTPIAIIGFEGQDIYQLDNTVDISGLLDTASSFLTAEIEQIALKLEDYSGASIDGTMTVRLGSTTLFESEAVTLTSDNTIITIPSTLRNILTLVNSGEFKIYLEGTTSIPIEDNSFKLIVTPQIRTTIEI